MEAKRPRHGRLIDAAAAPEWARAACLGKAGYLTWDLANRAISRNRFKPNNESRGRVGVYRCRFCSLWHIGAHHRNKRVR